MSLFARCLAAVCLLSIPFTAPVTQAQGNGGYSLLVSFGGGKNSPKVPYAPLVQDDAGNFYGTAQRGGRAGAVFSLSPNGTLSRFYQFQGGDGSVPTAALVRDADGNFYGTTQQGGYYGYGTVFRLTPDGTLTVLHDFGGTDDGTNPQGALVFGPDGFLYGTTSSGGYYDYGTVFRLATDGNDYSVGYDFGSSNDDAATPNAGLYTGKDGNLYGTTAYGGYSDYGTIFQITTDGTLTIFYDFGGTDGTYPDASLVQATDGNFYGTTSGGGPYDAGTVFRLTLDGALTTLYSFPDKTDGLQPEAALIQATDGQLYGTTYYGGTEGGGTVFSLALDGGGYAVLHDFAGGDFDGANPIAAVLQARDGTLYGTTAFGGLKRVGTAYRLSLGLPAINAVVSAKTKGLGTATFGVRNGRFLLTRTSTDLAQPLNIFYTLSGTAVNGVDYRALSGVATFPAGIDRLKIPVAPLQAVTAAKTVILTLSTPIDGSYTLGSSQSGTVQIAP